MARRIALTAQGFADARPSGRVDIRHVRRVLDRVAVLQLDPVNAVCRSHYLPVFARLGPYPRELLDRMSWGGRHRELFEYWAHQASLLPLSLHPLVRWRMQTASQWDWDAWCPTPRIPQGFPVAASLDPSLRLAPWAVIEGMTRLAKERPGLVDEVLAVVAERGPIAASDVVRDDPRRSYQKSGGMWNWKDSKIVLEWLFFMGNVTTAARRGAFERIYDLTERVLPPDLLAMRAPSQDDAQRELVRVAARAQGVATEKQLREYFHLPAKHAKARVAELVESGDLLPVRVEGVSQKMYLWPDVALRGRVRARALLSPFDSLIWDRDRTLRLFGFHYRISIYTQASKRTHGYYVMPFLLGDQLVARVDIKADRTRSTLVALAAHSEPEVDQRQVAAEMAEELRLMATWLELERVTAIRQGDLSQKLARALSTKR